MMRPVLFFALILLFCSIQKVECQQSFSDNERSWAMEQLKAMTLEEKIAQIIFIRVHSNKDEAYYTLKINEIEKYQPGGVCFFQGGPVREINLTNRIQKVSKIPLLVSMDAEWGVAMRLDSVPAFPRQMTLGAIPAKDNALIYEMGKAIAGQCKLLGIHLNFAPCVDVNNNAQNPVINSRSFGETPEQVVEKSWQYMSGMQDNGLIACIKHFPGHGDTQTDSHYSLPVIKKTKPQLWETELYPFQKLIEKGCEMIMVSHLNIPALDNTPGSIATTSFKIVTNLLKNEMGFNGIIITDGMEMDGLRKTYSTKNADAEIECLKAGIDVLLLPNELSIIIPLIKRAIENGEISEQSIDEKCLKVLKMKEKWGITSFKPLNSTDVVQSLNNTTDKDLIKLMETKALTLIKNENQFLPLQGTEKTCFLLIEDSENEQFVKKISQEFHLPFIKVKRTIKNEDISLLLTKFLPYDQIIVVYISNLTPVKHSYGVTEESLHLLNELGKTKKLILSWFGNPYALNQFKSLNRFNAVAVGYQPTENSVRSVIQAIFGESSFEGTLPVSVLDYKSQTHANIVQEKDNVQQISFLSEKIEKEIDEIIENGIRKKIFPGCQILAFKNGKPLFIKNYGTTNYQSENQVTEHTLYDVASITKPLATTLALMKLYDERKFSLKDSIGQYVSWLKGSDKSGLRIEELLTHTSGLQAFIPFYIKLHPDSAHHLYLNHVETQTFNIPVAHNLFLNSEYIDTIRKIICESKLKPQKYLYSDLNFFLLNEMIQNIIGQSCETYLLTEFFEPLELKDTYFNPALKGVALERIAPTENDTLFRKQVVHGYVHDQTSALMGGYAGNAGLFSTTRDLAVILEMLMNKGVYKGKRYLSEATVHLFTSSYPCHGVKRRGLGFDVPSAEKNADILPSQANAKTFGHQGFTGTVFWCDPNTELIYIFLSNAIFPTVEPRLLPKSKIRLLVHEKLYEGL